jgi:plastocyanin
MKQIHLGTLVILAALGGLSVLPARASLRGVGSAAEGPANPSLSTASTRSQVPDTVVIQIVADADSVVAVPGSVTVRRGQVVTWACDLGNWTVQFRSGQPFGDAAVSEGIRGTRGARFGQAVRADAQAGRYKYDILVRVEGGPPLRADPEIVIGPGDGPGR